MRRFCWLVALASSISTLALADPMTCNKGSSDFLCVTPCALKGTTWEVCGALPESDQERCRQDWAAQVDDRFHRTSKLGSAELQAIPETCRNRFETERLAVLQLIESGVPRGQPCPLRADRSRCGGPDCDPYASEERLLMAPFTEAQLRRIPERCRTDFVLEAMRLDRVRERHDTLAWVLPWGSAAICRAKLEETQAKAAIEKEKRDAKRLGIPVDERGQRIQQELVDLSGDLDTAGRRMVATAGKRALPCSDPKVHQLALCQMREHSNDEACQTTEIRFFTESAKVTEGAWPEVSDQPVTQPVAVRSAPTGQDVWLDGEKVGVTPLALDEVVGGEHLLEIRGDPRAFAPWETDLTITTGPRPEPVVATLIRREAKLEVMTKPPGAKVEIDGEVVGTTNASFRVLGGERRLHLTMPGYIDVERVIPVSPPATKSLSFDLVRKGTGQDGRFIAADLDLKYALPLPDLVLRPETRLIQTKGPWFLPVTITAGVALGMLGGGLGFLRAASLDIENRVDRTVPESDVQACWVTCPLIGAGIALALTALVALAVPPYEEKVPDQEAVEANTRARAQHEQARRENEAHDERVDHAIVKANEPVEAALMQNQGVAQ